MSSQRSLSSDEAELNPCMEPRQINQNAEKKPLTLGRAKIQSWLDKSLKVTMTDTRILVGDFLCTDRMGNIILGITYEYTDEKSEGRYLGSVMVPGKHIVKMEVDLSPNTGSRGQHRALQQEHALQQQQQQQQVMQQYEKQQWEEDRHEIHEQSEEDLCKKFNTVGV